MAAQIRAGDDGRELAGLDVTLRENPDAWASYSLDFERPLGPMPDAAGQPVRLRLVVPGNIRHNSGGNVYNAALARELAALGASVDVCPVDGDWPVGSAEDRRRLAGLLRDGDGGPPDSGRRRAHRNDRGRAARLRRARRTGGRRSRRAAGLDPAAHAAAGPSGAGDSGPCGPPPA